MPSASFHFPKGFLWGTATASHQVEGGNTNNNWYKWEQEG
ncbi:MAG: family 1 glycosylhydrolase, partial [Nitrospirota bacterium]